VSITEATAVVHRRTVTVPEEALRAVTDALWRSGATSARATRVDYLMHPWVVDVRRLEAAGWRAEHSNRDALAVLAAAEAPYLRVGRRRVRRDRVALGAAATVAAGAATTLAAAAAITRRTRR
jgi:hypothetical protein